MGRSRHLRPRVFGERVAFVVWVAVAMSGCLGSTTIIDTTPHDGSVVAHEDAGTVEIDGAVELPPTALPFDPIGPYSYVPKVKGLLTGLAATDAEVQAVASAADPQAALRTLIDGWMALPEHELKMRDFFRNAFQQNQVTFDSVLQTAGVRGPVLINGGYIPRLNRSFMDAFARTAWDIVATGRPFTDTITTPRYMLTTAQLVLLSYLDEMLVDDTDHRTNRLDQRAAIAKVVIDPKSTATPAQSLDPTSPSYMVWKTGMVIPTGCNATPVTYTADDKYVVLLDILLGRVQYKPCFPTNDPAFQPVLDEADWTDWHPVTLKQTSLASPNTSPSFWKISALRTATEVTLHTPRVGFMGTFAFGANWPTNTDNQARVTANQALIVSIGRSINGANTTATFPLATTDAAHAADPACSGCHAQLDPLRQYVRQSWSLSYHDQTDAAQIAAPAAFAIDGVTATGTGGGIPELAGTLASHPRFALAWAQKLHFWANNTAAVETDPELVRIASAFATSGHDWKTLVRELFSSPLVTFASATATTTQAGVTLSITRRDHYCAALSNRLGLPDVCALVALNTTQQQIAIRARTTLIPIDTYFRAYELPSLATDPDLFFRASAEAMCRSVADLVVDAGATPRYRSDTPIPAIEDFVTTLMSVVPSDPRHQGLVDLLTAHRAAAMAAPISATARHALKSTFTLACIAPTNAMVGL